MGTKAHKSILYTFTTNHVKMRFYHYPSFKNHYQTAPMKELTQFLETNTDHWIATEKLHGSNFSIYTDGTVIEYGRRNAFLSENENFHGGAQLFKSKYSDCVKQIAAQLITEDVKYIIIYGELFGKNIQIGVEYGEDVKFRAFDIAVVKDNGNFSFIDFTKMEDLCNQFELPMVPKIAEGKLNDLLKLDPKFVSTVLNTPGNLAEGYVIKYFKEPDNLDIEEDNRKMIKFKNPNFDEMASGKKKPKPAKKVENEDFPQEFLDFFNNEFVPRLTFARLQAVKSKLSAKQAKNKNTLTLNMVEDVAAEVKEEIAPFNAIESQKAKFMKTTGEFVGMYLRLLLVSNEEYKKFESLKEKAENYLEENVDLFVKESLIVGETVNVGALKMKTIEAVGELDNKMKGLLMPFIMHAIKNLGS